MQEKIETWKPLLIDHFEDFEISSSCRIRTPKGKVYEPRRNLNGTWKFEFARYINGIKYRFNRSAGRLYLEYFSNVNLNGKLVRVGKVWGIENLKIACFIPPSTQQKIMFEKYFYPTIKNEIKKKNLNQLYFIDLDDCIQETALKLFEWIGRRNIDYIGSFIKCVRTSFDRVVKQEIKRVSHLRYCSLEDILFI